MSSANRGAARATGDFYPTPAWCVDALLRAMLLEYLPSGAGQVWVDPAYGDGAIQKATDAWIKSWRNVGAAPKWDAFEIERHEIDWRLVDKKWVATPSNRLRSKPPPNVGLLYADFLKVRPGTLAVRSAAVVITNPPFSLAMEFIEHSMLLYPNATIVFLLRLNFLGSGKRASFWHEHMPDVFVLPRRPSFTPDGKTDSTEYAWFVWPAGGHHRRRGEISVLKMEEG